MPSGFNRFLFGDPGRFQQVSNLDPSQMGLQRQAVSASMGQGAGGAFGDVADYYRSLMNPSDQQFNDFSAPEMRRYREQYIPDLAEQFAGMGSGALSSSGFRNAATQQASSLSERLASMRAGLRQQGAQGLMGIGSQGLSQYMENIYRPATSGFLEQIAPIAGQMGAAGIGGWASGRALASLGRMTKGSQSPYG